MLKNHILTHNVVGMQKSIQALLEKHFNRAIRRMPMLEDVDTENVEPQVISSLIRYAHENKSPSYSYESGLFSADFTSKADLTSFMEIIHDYYWVRHYEVDMEVTDDMTSLDLESLPDDAEGNFTIHVEIDSSIVQYPCGYVDEDRQVINEKSTTDLHHKTLIGYGRTSPQADCRVACAQRIVTANPFRDRRELQPQIDKCGKDTCSDLPSTSNERIYLSAKNFIGFPPIGDMEGQSIWKKMTPEQRDASKAHAIKAGLTYRPHPDTGDIKDHRIWTALPVATRNKIMKDKIDAGQSIYDATPIEKKSLMKRIALLLKTPLTECDDEPDCDCEDNADSNYITETAAKKRVVIRDGKKTTEMQCPKGTIFNPDTKQCRKMKPAEIKNRHLAGLRTARANKNQMKAINVKRNRSRDKAKHI